MKPKSRKRPLTRAVEPIAYSIANAAKAVALDRTRLMEACKVGDLPIYKSPNTTTIRILRADLENLFRQHWERYYG